MSQKSALPLALFLFLATGVGCSAPAEAASPPSPTPGMSLLERGAEHAERGESLRAEQYYLAALDAGVSPREVTPLLLQTCLRSGRLQRALMHAEDAWYRSGNPALRSLIAELRLALEVTSSGRAGESHMAAERGL